MSIEEVFQRHSKFHKKWAQVDTSLKTESGLDVKLTWNEIDSISVRSQLFDAASDNLFLLLHISDFIYNDTYFNPEREEAIKIGLSVAFDGRSFETSICMSRYFEVEKTDPNNQKYLLVGLDLATQRVQYQIFEPLLKLRQILRVDAQQVHFTFRLERAKLNKLKYKTGYMHVNDRLDQAISTARTEYTGVCSMTNNLETASGGISFCMESDFYSVGEFLDHPNSS